MNWKSVSVLPYQTVLLKGEVCLQSISPKSSTFSISLPSSVQKPVHAQAISQGDLHKPESEGTMNGEFSRETTFHSEFD